MRFLLMNTPKATFSVTQEAWYAHPALGVGDLYRHPEIMVHGSDAELALRWQKEGPRLEAYDESWKLLAKLPDFLALLADWSDKDISPETAVEGLKALGYRDVTKRQPPREHKALFDAKVKEYLASSNPSPHETSRSRRVTPR